jgi:hypothetical protein
MLDLSPDVAVEYIAMCPAWYVPGSSPSTETDFRDWGARYFSELIQGGAWMGITLTVLLAIVPCKRYC